jgi:hypothetical protein
MNAKVIKMIGTKNFVLSLYESASGRYYIEYEVGEKVTMSEPMADFKNATFLFDLKLQELEGN